MLGSFLLWDVTRSPVMEGRFEYIEQIVADSR